MSDDAMAPDLPHLLEPAKVRARRRIVAVLVVWLWEIVAAYVIATPLSAWAKAVFGARPDGDAAIFRPGGHSLLSWVAHDPATLSVVLRSTLVALLLFGVLGQLVTGALVASLATGTGPRDRSAPLAFAVRAGAKAFAPLLGIGVAAGALEGLVLAIGFFASSAIDRALLGSTGDAGAFAARVAVLGVFTLTALLVGLIADLAKVVVARDVAADIEAPASTRLLLRDGALAALRTARRSIGRATIAWGWRALVGLALVWVGAKASDLTGDRDGAALWLLFAVHQLVVVARVFLRASWLANALRILAPSATC